MHQPRRITERPGASSAGLFYRGAAPDPGIFEKDDDVCGYAFIVGDAVQAGKPMTAKMMGDRFQQAAVPPPITGEPHRPGWPPGRECGRRKAENLRSLSGSPSD